MTAPLCPAGPGGVAVPRAGLKKLVLPPDYSGITIPEKPKLKFMDKVPAVPKVRREPRRLRDIRGPSREATDFTQGQYGILAGHSALCPIPVSLSYPTPYPNLSHLYP
ncbi:hypothetical protein WISP_00739 [Willisornis vidua]|uniref:Uncharacterized protein n=1 Tax=Willisornis vidua TaxID=1566151 RepID=A0ABQ9DV36_9PASS|nr:hypothetical protein WISP_00739 [Willisornis vidua]